MGNPGAKTTPLCLPSTTDLMLLLLTSGSRIIENFVVRLGSNINRIMSPKRDMTKAAIRFHRRWLSFLLCSSMQTMRRVAHELCALEAENRDYRDGAIFCLLRRDLEFVVRDIGGTNWSVARSRRDLRGRTRRHPCVPIDHHLQKELRYRPLPTIGENSVESPIVGLR
jgi:hypothetical protein